MSLHPRLDWCTASTKPLVFPSKHEAIIPQNHLGICTARICISVFNFKHSSYFIKPGIVKTLCVAIEYFASAKPFVSYSTDKSMAMIQRQEVL